MVSSGVPRNFFREGGSTNSVEDRGQRERGSGGSSPIVRGSGESCNLVQEISFYVVIFFGTLRLFMMTTNLFVIANVKQLRTGGSFRIVLPFFRTSLSVGFLNSAIFNSFSKSGWVWHDFGRPSEFRRGGGLNPQPPSVRH